VNFILRGGINIRISFDLDDTLFVDAKQINAEPLLSFPYSLIYKERLRLGTPELMNKIREEGIEIWIYTTSYRTPRYIRNYFKHYKVKIDGIVNGDRHYREVQQNHNYILPSKLPNKYRIDLHIDDDISVKKNGEANGFRVYILKEENENWTKELWDFVMKIKSNLELAR
jgi:hypothetical protein